MVEFKKKADKIIKEQYGIEFEKRFQLEDAGMVPSDRKFRWKMIAEMEDKK